MHRVHILVLLQPHAWLSLGQGYGWFWVHDCMLYIILGQALMTIHAHLRLTILQHYHLSSMTLQHLPLLSLKAHHSNHHLAISQFSLKVPSLLCVDDTDTTTPHTLVHASPLISPALHTVLYSTFTFFPPLPLASAKHFAIPQYFYSC